MEIGKETKNITQLEFKGDDFEKCEKIALKLGYTQTVYTSSSALMGLFCQVTHKQYAKGLKNGCIIKTEQFGFMFVQDLEDLELLEVV